MQQSSKPRDGQLSLFQTSAPSPALPREVSQKTESLLARTLCQVGCRWSAAHERCDRSRRQSCRSPRRLCHEDFGDHSYAFAVAHPSGPPSTRCNSGLSPTPAGPVMNIILAMNKSLPPISDSVLRMGSTRSEGSLSPGPVILVSVALTWAEPSRCVR